MIALKAYAKINLGLRILSKRNDGYHDIETVFHRINLFDEVAITPSSQISMLCSNERLPVDDNNLCIKAARLLQKKYNVNEGAYINLKKNIPIGAGLGGGSSDAATTLLGLKQLWNVSIKDSQLTEIAAQLGSDVPYFLKSGTSSATGRGEVLDYFRLDVPYWILLVYPNITVSTAWAYQNIRPNLQPKHSLKKILTDSISNPKILADNVSNDFEPLVLEKHKSIAEVKQEIHDSGAEFLQMSGSGSSVFGFFTIEEIARKAERKLSGQNRVFLTPPNFQPQ